MRIFKLAIFLYLFFITSLFAASQVTIYGGNDQLIPLALKKVTSNDVQTLNLSYEIKKRVKLLLEDSKIFEVYDEDEIANYSFFKKLIPNFSKKPDLLGELSMTIVKNSETNSTAIITLSDPIIPENSFSKKINFNPKFWTRGASKIADQIFQEYTNIPGYFTSKMVFLSEQGKLTKRKKKIVTMDFAGDNFQEITDDKYITLTPRFSPDGSKIIYVSYKEGRPTLFLHNLNTKKTRRLIKFDGMLYAPRFSPDGSQIVLSASFEGNSEIALYDLNLKKLIRLTNHIAIDTSPSFSPDGSQIVFSSDRTGSQRLYVMNVNGKNLKAISFESGQYASPNWSPDGKYIAFTKLHKNKFHIGIINLDTLEAEILTESYKDESPSWAPNSRYLIFTRRKPASRWSKKNLSQLFLINLNGEIIKKIPTLFDAADADWIKL